MSQARTIFKTRNRVCSKNKNSILKIFKIIILSGRIHLLNTQKHITLHNFGKYEFRSKPTFYYLGFSLDSYALQKRTWWFTQVSIMWYFQPSKSKIFLGFFLATSTTCFLSFIFNIYPKLNFDYSLISLLLQFPYAILIKVMLNADAYEVLQSDRHEGIEGLGHILRWYSVAVT